MRPKQRMKRPTRWCEIPLFPFRCSPKEKTCGNSGTGALNSPPSAAPISGVPRRSGKQRMMKYQKVSVGYCVEHLPAAPIDRVLE